MLVAKLMTPVEVLTKFNHPVEEKVPALAPDPKTGDGFDSPEHTLAEG